MRLCSRAKAVAAVREDTPSLLKMFCRCRATVCSLIIKVEEISRLVHPVATRLRTCTSGCQPPFSRTSEYRGPTRSMMSPTTEANRLGRTPAAQEWLPHGWRHVARVLPIQVDSRWNDLVDTIKNVVAQRDIHGAQLRFQLLHRAWTNDRRCHRGRGQRKGKSEMD